MTNTKTFGVFSEDYRESFWNYMRDKKYNSDNLFHGVSNMGAYEIPLTEKSPFKASLKKHSVFREISNVFAKKKLGSYIAVQDCNDWAGWLEENEAIPLKDAASDYTEEHFKKHKIAALCKLPETFVLDAKFDVEKNISVRLGKSFAKAETYG